jgi:hypothetical protein
MRDPDSPLNNLLLVEVRQAPGRNGQLYFGPIDHLGNGWELARRARDGLLPAIVSRPRTNVIRKKILFHPFDAAKSTTTNG